MFMLKAIATTFMVNQCDVFDISESIVILLVKAQEAWERLPGEVPILKLKITNFYCISFNITIMFELKH